MFKKKAKRDCDPAEKPTQEELDKGKAEDTEVVLKYDYFRKFVTTNMQGEGELKTGFTIGGWKSFKISETDDILMSAWINKSKDANCKVVITVHDLSDHKELQTLEIKQCFNQYGDVMLEFLPTTKEILFTQSGDNLTNVWIYQWMPLKREFDKGMVVDLKFSWIMEAIPVPSQELLFFGTRGNGLLVHRLKDKIGLKRIAKVNETYCMLLINRDFLLIGGGEGEIYLLNILKWSTKSMLIFEHDVTSSDFFVEGRGKVEVITEDFSNFRIFLGDYNGFLKVCTFEPKSSNFLTEIFSLKANDEILQSYFLNDSEILFTALDNKLYLLNYKEKKLARNMIPEVMFKVDYFQIDSVRGRIFFREYRNKRILIIK